MFLRLGLLMASVVVLGACAPLAAPAPLPTGTPTSVPPTPEAPAGKISPADAPTDLMGTRWNLTGYGPADALKTPVAPATLDIAGENLGGSTGCNSYNVVFWVKDGQITFAEQGPITTMMACEDAVMQQENDFLKILMGVTTYQLDGDHLTLNGTEGQLTLAAVVDAQLVGPTWHLNGLAQNGAIGMNAGDELITLTFAADQAQGFAGCNNYFGTYTLKEDALTFGPLGSTKMYCDATSARETEFLTALQTTAAYRIERQQLTLFNAEGQVVMVLVAEK